MSKIVYEAIDRWNGPYLVHYKYLKKIKIGNRVRYFYSLKDLQAYYNEQKKLRDETDKEAYATLNDAKQFIVEDVVTARDRKRKGLIDARNSVGFKSDVERLQAYKDTDKAQKELIKMNSRNSIMTAIDTGRFAVRNVLGSSSKKKLKKRYINSGEKDYSRYYSSRDKWANKYAKRMNELYVGTKL